MKRILLLLSLLCSLASAQGWVQNPNRYADPRQIFGVYSSSSAGIVDWWPMWQSTILKSHTDGTVTVGNGTTVGYAKGIVNSTVLTAANNLSADPYNASALGSRGGIAFAAASHGLRGSLAHTFTHGCTWIVIGKFTAVSATFKAIAAVGPDTATNPASSTNGFLFGTDAAGTTIACERNGVLTSSTIANSTPYLFVATADRSIQSGVNITAVTTYSGYQGLSVNGGYAKAYSFASDNTSIAANYVSIGGRTDAYAGAAFTICDAILIDGIPTPQQLQRFYQQYVLPVYGSSAPSCSQYPTAKGERNPFSGPGLNVGWGLAPIPDMQAMGFSWVRVDTSGITLSQAKVDEIIDYYTAAGIKICWLLQIDPTAGVFAVPSSNAQLICGRYKAKNLGTPFFELGNEFAQSYLVSQFSSNETNLRAAYLTLMQSWQSAMAGYDCITSYANDAPPYVQRMYETASAAGVRADVWGCHFYGDSADAPGTYDMMQTLTQASVVVTESNATGNTVTLSDATAWLSGLLGNMGSRPWSYYTSATASAWNGTTNAYPLYTSAVADANGIYVYSSRSQTLTDGATAAGKALPGLFHWLP